MSPFPTFVVLGKRYAPMETFTSRDSRLLKQCIVRGGRAEVQVSRVHSIRWTHEELTWLA